MALVVDQNATGEAPADPEIEMRTCNRHDTAQVFETVRGKAIHDAQAHGIRSEKHRRAESKQKKGKRKKSERVFLTKPARGAKGVSARRAVAALEFRPFDVEINGLRIVLEPAGSLLIVNGLQSFRTDLRLRDDGR